MQKRFVILALAIAAALLMVTVFALLTSIKTVPSSGTVYAFRVDVWANAGCDDELFKINWTTVNPGGSTTQNIWVKNNDLGDLDMSLSMTTANWVSTPSNGTDVYGITIGWDQEGTVLTSGENVAATLTLSVPDNDYTKDGLIFDVEIIITGTNSTFPP